MAFMEALPQAHRDELVEYHDNVESVAAAFMDRPGMLRWLEGFHRTVEQGLNYDGKPLPETFFDRQRGDETVRFGEQVYSGVTADLRYVDVRMDQSGYHRMVIIGNPHASWTEPGVYDGSSRAELSGTMRIDYMKHDNANPWLAHFHPANFPEQPVENRDSVIVTQPIDGPRTAVFHDGLTHQDVECFPLSEVMSTIRDLEMRPSATVIDLDEWRHTAGKHALDHL